MPSGTSVGRRIHVVGNTCSGKTTLGERLANVLDAPFVELDAIDWQPRWVSLAETNPEEFERRISEETAGGSWIVAGSYATFSQRVFWPRLQAAIWLDLPLPRLVWRVVSRSWRRWRSKELLWGANHERFWPQLMVWNKKDSLIRTRLERLQMHRNLQRLAHGSRSTTTIGPGSFWRTTLSGISTPRPTRGRNVRLLSVHYSHMSSMHADVCIVPESEKPDPHGYPGVGLAAH